MNHFSGFICLFLVSSIPAPAAYADNPAARADNAAVL
jgi:hypothetical protein